METLSSIFVGLVMIANTLVPQANLPTVLGIDDTTEVKIEETENEVEDGEEDVKETETKDDSLGDRKGKNRGLIGEIVEKKKLEGLREERKEQKEKEREDFKSKLADIKDERKKKVLENMDVRLGKINERRVEHFNKILDRLSEILDKVKTKNPDSELVGIAQDLIDTAQELVDAQSEKEYTVEIESEENLGQSAKITIETLKSDFKIIETKIKEAKEAIRNIVKSIKPNENEE